MWRLILLEQTLPLKEIPNKPVKNNLQMSTPLGNEIANTSAEKKSIRSIRLTKLTFSSYRKLSHCQDLFNWFRNILAKVIDLR